MKKIFILSFLCLILKLYALSITTSILPFKYLIDTIGGKYVKTYTLLKPWENPHHFEPDIKRILDISKSNTYFKSRFSEEDLWIKRIKQINPKITVFNISNGIKKRVLEGTENKIDPHIWLSYKNLEIISKNIYNSLIHLDNKNKAYYKSNLNKLLLKIKKRIEAIDKIKYKHIHKSFIIHHPVLGYLCDDLGITQIPIEIESKEPTIKQVINIIKKAKKLNIKLIFVQEGFDKKTAILIANRIKGNVKSFNPLFKNPLKTLSIIIKSLQYE